MAKKRRSSDRSRQRDNNLIANDLASLLSAPSPLAFSAPAVFPEVEDRREFHPGHRPARRLNGVPVRRLVEAFKPKARTSIAPPVGVLSFPSPRSVLVCVRRQARKEVLHALRRTRKGAGARRRRRSSFSGVSCK